MVIDEPAVIKIESTHQLFKITVVHVPKSIQDGTEFMVVQFAILINVSIRKQFSDIVVLSAVFTQDPFYLRPERYRSSRFGAQTFIAGKGN